jgi:hypothetical protein
LSIHRSDLDFSDGAGQGVTGAQLGTLQRYIRPYGAALLGPLVAASFGSSVYRSQTPR